ncbi:MAG: TonB-dependent receptor [Gammaproteobacteria bacterium]|nr:TonB-dependent receptor [Gammaproteobacteria bacterium]
MLLIATLLASGARAEIVEELVVTARKVDEQLQDVSASLQVLSGDFLDTADLSRLYELQYAVPGLVVNNVGMFGARFALRGVTDEGGSSLAIANHLNGAYLGSGNLAIARSFDMERVEVLKGPQGTLYGRNATGGSINFVTRPAEHEFDAGFESAYGSFDTTRLQGHLNVPFAVGAARLAFIGSEGDGYIDNSLDGREFGEADFWGLRGSVALDPTEDLHLDFYGATRGRRWRGG